MKIYRSLEELPADFGPVVATIGNFDGVHRAHQWVIAQVNARARTLTQQGQALRSLLITFDPHPVRVLRPEAPHSLITPLDQKLSLLSKTEIDATLIIPFTTEFSRLSARQFAEILAHRVHVLEVHEGENFRFGYQAQAGMDGLEQLGRDLGFAVQTYSPHILRAAPVSSSRVRALIAAGDLAHARTLTGRPFTIHSTPAPGRGYGTRYTVPTINLAPYTELLPANGVYVTTLTVAGETFHAVTNVGNRPTFGADSFTVESHLLDFHPIDLSEFTPLELTFLHRLRPEIRWPNPEALRTQIGLDVQRATRYFALCRTLVPQREKASAT